MRAASTPEERLAACGWSLPAIPEAKGLYQPALLDGSTLHLSAHGPFSPEEPGAFTHHGKIGDSLSVADGCAAAEAVGLGLLASIRQALGDLDRVERTLALVGYLNAGPDFTDHVRVLDATSRVLVDVLAQAGTHTRTVVGVATLPFDLPLVASLTLRCVHAASQRSQR